MKKKTRMALAVEISKPELCRIVKRRCGPSWGGGGGGVGGVGPPLRALVQSYSRLPARPGNFFQRQILLDDNNPDPGRALMF